MGNEPPATETPHSLEKMSPFGAPVLRPLRIGAAIKGFGCFDINRLWATSNVASPIRHLL
jgi:hypothetical protein